MAKRPKARTKLDRSRIEDAFDRVGRKALARGLETELAVYGGSCLVLATNIRESSADIDAVFDEASRSALYEIVAEVADELGISPDWMNEAVKRTAPPPGEPPPPRIAFGDYPRDTSTGTGLRVFLPTPEYMLAMKSSPIGRASLRKTERARRMPVMQSHSWGSPA